MLFDEALKNSGFLFIDKDYWKLFISIDESVSEGRKTLHKTIKICQSLGIPILDARTTRIVISPPVWEDREDDFHRFRTIGVYVSTPCHSS